MVSEDAIAGNFAETSGTACSRGLTDPTFPGDAIDEFSSSSSVFAFGTSFCTATRAAAVSSTAFSWEATPSTALPGLYGLPRCSALSINNGVNGKEVAILSSAIPTCSGLPEAVAISSPPTMERTSSLSLCRRTILPLRICLIIASWIESPTL